MVRAITIVVTLLMFGLFAWAIPVARLFDALQPLIMLLSILVAALYVRLNRGMPTLEWKSLDPDKRKHLTASILGVTIDYGWIIGICAITLAGLLSLTVIGITDANSWTLIVSRTVSGTIGGLVTLCVARMAYVVWRDIDIVRLQKYLIDEAATRESFEHQRARAQEKLATMRSANLRSVEVKPPKAWDE